MWAHSLIEYRIINLLKKNQIFTCHFLMTLINSY